MALKRSQNEHIEQLAFMRGLFLTELYGLNEQEENRLRKETVCFLENELNRSLISRHIESDGKIAAVAFLNVNQKLPHPKRKSGKTGTLLNVYTREKYRKNGFAEKLILALIADAKDLMLDSIELSATEAGFSLYKKIGFKETQVEERPMVMNFS